MKTIKTFEKFSTDTEELMTIRNSLIEIEKEAEETVANLNQTDIANHTELGKRYGMFRLLNDISEITFRTVKLKNYLDFLKYGYD